ncbi:hypothetical protein ACFQY0_07675 [Haloferula chungangensis]|uniref:Serine protease n=1 Tax=Haloferula chungangensis TaxID=1048331 RepID=A0ABW2L3W8_9BACT
MILRLSFLLFLLASCGAPSAPPLHHPDLSLPELAKAAESDSAVFSSYSPSSAVRWNQGWPWKFDLTGIGWDSPITVTAITSRHVVMANHYQRKAGRSAVFHDREGKPHRRVILKVVPTSKVGLGSDVAVGLLDQPLPKSIRTYPILSVTSEDAGQLVGAHVLVTEQKRRLFFHQVRSVHESFIHFRFDPHLADSRKKHLVTGDSGNPSFILSKGELALIETHTTGGPGAGPFYGSSQMIAALEKIIAETDASYQLRTVGIDQKVLKDAKACRASMPKPVSAPPASTTPRSNSSDTTPSAKTTRTPRPRVVVPENP